ncbi:MAG: 50S ribosomal protein L13 [Candidatus Diapherotrites archaeon]
MNWILVDASDAKMGRMASEVAKRLLKGESIAIVNCEKAVVSGNKENILHRFQVRVDRHAKGNPMKGPKYSRMPDRIVKYSIRTMMPFRRERGRQALKRLRVYVGIPNQLKGKEFVQFPESMKPVSGKAYSVKQISQLLGAKVEA